MEQLAIERAALHRPVLMCLLVAAAVKAFTESTGHPSDHMFGWIEIEERVMLLLFSELHQRGTNGPAGCKPNCENLHEEDCHHTILRRLHSF